MAFTANEPLDKFDSRHEIFPTRSPVSNIDPVKDPPASISRKRYGKLAELAYSRLKPLLKTREALNKVYSDSYFENHYPEADKTLKGLLHDSTMDAWSNAENPSEEVLSSVAEGRGLGASGPVTNHTDNSSRVDSSDKRQITLTINLGK